MIALKKIKKFIILGMVLINSLVSHSFTIDNILYNQRMDSDDGGYREIGIVNDRTSKKRYRVNVLPGESGADASKFIEVYPKVVTINPKSKETLKVLAKSPKGMEKKEYSFMLQFIPIVIPTMANRTEKNISGNGSLAIAPIIGFTCYVGEVDFSKVLRLENIKITKISEDIGIKVEGELFNDSYASVDFSATAYGINNFLYDTAPVGNLSGNTKGKKIALMFPRIKEIKDLRKIVFYQANPKIKLKEIKLEN